MEGKIGIVNIGIDARPLSKIKTGIGYYLYSLIKELPKECSQFNFYLFSDKDIDLDFSYPNLKIIVDKKLKFLKGTLWYILRMRSLLKKFDIRIFWGTQHILPLINNKKITKILTIHDLVYIKFPETMDRLNYVINKLMLPYSIKKADIIIAVSNSTKEDILSNFDISEKKIKVIYNPVVVYEIDSTLEKETLAKFNLDKERFILYVGTIEPRKNIETLLKISGEVFMRTGMKVVLAGKIGWKSDNIYNLIKEYSEKGYIKYLGYINDIDKAVLMKNCFLFVFPSLYEGFGLPVVEAMKYGALVLVADTSSLRELIENEYFRFKPLDHQRLKEKILELYTNKDLYLHSKHQLKKNIDKFNTKKILKEYMDLFLSCEGV